MEHQQRPSFSKYVTKITREEAAVDKLSRVRVVMMGSLLCSLICIVFAAITAVTVQAGSFHLWLCCVCSLCDSVFRNHHSTNPKCFQVQKSNQTVVDSDEQTWPKKKKKQLIWAVFTVTKREIESNWWNGSIASPTKGVIISLKEVTLFVHECFCEGL